MLMAKKPSVRSPMSLAGCGKRQRGPCPACAMTGLGAVDYRVPINRHVRPACSPIKHSSNGLHDTLQRALGPDLGHNPRPRLFSVCRKPALPPTAPQPPPTRSVFVQVTAQHDLCRRRTAACCNDSSLASRCPPDDAAALLTRLRPYLRRQTDLCSRALTSAEPPTATSPTRQTFHLQTLQHHICTPPSTNNNTKQTKQTTTPLHSTFSSVRSTYTKPLQFGDTAPR
jgi:hypothetical protein